jgi:membrane protease YdiL (CAAX protease family)
MRPEPAAPPPDDARGPAGGTTPEQVPWALVAAPLVLQLAATILLATILAPPRSVDTAIYSIRYGVVLLLSYAVLVGATVVVADRFGDPKELLALRTVPAGRCIGYGLAGFAAASLAAIVLEPLFHGIKAQGFHPNPFPGGAAHVAGLALVAIGFALAAPIGEELYFRGLLLGRLLGHGPAVAVGVQALVFGAAHFTPAALPVLAVYGAVFGVVRVRTNSILPGALAHALNNGLALALAVAAA